MIEFNKNLYDFLVGKGVRIEVSHLLKKEDGLYHIKHKTPTPPLLLNPVTISMMVRRDHLIKKWFQEKEAGKFIMTKEARKKSRELPREYLVKFAEAREFWRHSLNWSVAQKLAYAFEHWE